MGGKTYKRTREHLKTRNADSPKPNKPPGDTGSQETYKQTTDGDSRPLPTPYVQLQHLDPTKLNLGQEATTTSCVANYKDKFKLKIYITRAGRTTKFPKKYCGFPLSLVVYKSTMWLYVGLGEFPCRARHPRKYACGRAPCVR